MNTPHNFTDQFTLSQRDYLASLDFFTWTRHFYVLRDLVAGVQGDVLEVGTGDGVVRRCVEPFVGSYKVMDINAELNPDVQGDIRQPQPSLIDGFDAVVATEVLEHLPFADVAGCLCNLKTYLRPGGELYLTLPHRKGHMLIVTPNQKLLKWRFPIGLTNLSEAYNRFVRRRIWIDPNHCWEIGDGKIRRNQISELLQQLGWEVKKFQPLPYCDYWVLRKPKD